MVSFSVGKRADHSEGGKIRVTGTCRTPSGIVGGKIRSVPGFRPGRKGRPTTGAPGESPEVKRHRRSTRVQRMGTAASRLRSLVDRVRTE